MTKRPRPWGDNEDQSRIRKSHLSQKDLEKRSESAMVTVHSKTLDKLFQGAKKLSEISNQMKCDSCVSLRGGASISRCISCQSLACNFCQDRCDTCSSFVCGKCSIQAWVQRKWRKLPPFQTFTYLLYKLKWHTWCEGGIHRFAVVLYTL